MIKGLGGRWKTYPDPTYPRSGAMIGHRDQWAQPGQLVRWKKCVGRITRLINDGAAHVRFFWPTVWFNDVMLGELKPVELLDVIAEEA